MTNHPPDPIESTRKPDWLKVKFPSHEEYFAVSALLRKHGLHTICRSAQCPNRTECWSEKTATFLILGDVCTRNCAFCAVSKGTPAPLSPDEPSQVAEAAAALGLKYVVVTSVTRDDLADGGALQFAAVIGALRARIPGVLIETLVPDFGGAAEPLGEPEDELRQSLADLREAGCDLLTIGQYLRPTRTHPAVARYYTPDEFRLWRDEALRLGFRDVESGPLVRSSFRAHRMYETLAPAPDSPCAT